MGFTMLDEAFVNRHLTPAVCTPLMREALVREASGEYRQYLRTAIPLPNGNVLGLMPGWVGDCFGAKVISVYHHNAAKGYPSHQGQILLFGERFGDILASVDAMAVTKIRTGAVSAAASLALARKDSRTLAVLGCGAQGESHVLAIAASFALTDVYLWDLYPETAERLGARLRRQRSAGQHEQSEMSGQTDDGEQETGYRIHVCDTAEEAVREADIICTVTPSAVPVLHADWVRKGAHINAVGACAPNARELDSALVAGSAFFCDNVESVLHESGDFLFPRKEGLIADTHIRGTVGQVLNGQIPGRISDREITVFEALGMAVEDIAAAKYLYDFSRQFNS